MFRDKRIMLIYVITISLLVFIIGFTLANNSSFENNKINTDIISIDEDAFLDDNEINIDELRPILDKDIYKYDEYIVSKRFYIGANVKNTLKGVYYNVSLIDIEIDCDLLSPYLKWKLIKNNEVISIGSFDYKFDTIKDNRLILTNEKHKLKDYSISKKDYDYFEFYLWFSDSCQDDDMSFCTNANYQTYLINKHIKAKISVDLYGDNEANARRDKKDKIDYSTCIRDVDSDE